MTNQKHLKSRVRERMAKTGERYAAARANVVASGDPAGDATAAAAAGTPHHLPGIHAETTAIRVLAAAAGVTNPATGAAPSEELALLAGGGIGAAVFTFKYPEFSSLYLAGRNRIDDTLGFVRDGLERLGVAVEVAETSGVAAARRNLQHALEAGPAIAWLDLVELGTRGVPKEMSGGGYHAVVVHGIDSATGDVTIGDLRNAAEVVDAETLATARARIRSFRHRVVGLHADARPPSKTDLASAVRQGLATTVDGLRNPRMTMFGIDAFARLADRMVAPNGADAWSVVFPRGPRLVEALRSLHEYVELFGTGGGLMRPMFARGLAEAADLTGDRRLASLGTRYAEIGAAWSELAGAALPDEAPALRAVREAVHARDEAYRTGADEEAMRRLAGRAQAAQAAAGADFPLTAADTAALLVDLSGRLRGIAAQETALLGELEATVAA